VFALETKAVCAAQTLRGRGIKRIHIHITFADGAFGHFAD
jgi:hypothetical protein